jgi:three-Cys-motif partner protein
MVSLYSTLFSSGMKAKWSNRTYVELYAGAGRGKVRGTAKIIHGSPLLALTVKNPFDKYIFCEENAENLEALKARSQQVG